jgi:hypothetical protein
MNQMRQGVLHLHGYWEWPQSVIFGTASYQRIIDDETFQALFKHLWLGYHWLYIGCGQGAHDPNFGRLIRWGAKNFGAHSLPDFRLCLEADLAALRLEHQDQPNLRLVSYGKKHDALPRFLCRLTESLPCRPFIPINEQAQFFRVAGQPPEDVILPSRKEFDRGEVHRPLFLRALTSRLHRNAFAWLRGPRSHGKTTAALLVATSKAQRNHAVYYLDLNETPVAPIGSNVESVMESLCRPGVLFILDNVNRNETLARRLFDAWDKQRRGSRLLFLGRYEPETISPSNETRHLADLAKEAIFARVEQADFEGLFCMLLRRLAPGKPPPVPPGEVLEVWQKTFSSDLVAFCWAVTAQHRKLRLSNWELPPDAARQYVRTKYLRPLSSEEQRNVLLLAAFAREELGLPAEAFNSDPFPASLRTGLIRQTLNDGIGNERFQFSEPGLGELLLGAASDFDPSAQILTTCSLVPSAAVAYGARMEAIGERARGREIMLLLVGSLRAARWLLAEHLPWGVDTFRRMLRLDAALPAEIDSWLVREPEHLALSLESQPLNILGHLLRYASEHLPILAERFRFFLADPIRQDAVAKRLSRTSPYELIQFLEDAKACGSKTAVQALWAKVAVPEHVSRFISQGLQGSLHNLDFVLRKATAHRRKHFVTLLWSELEQPDSLDRLIRLALYGSLHLFANFADYASHMERSELASSLWQGIGQRRHWSQVRTRILKDGPQNVVTFLKAASDNDQSPLVEWLWKALLAPRHQVSFLVHALEGSLHNLTTFLNHAQRDGRQAFLSSFWPRLMQPKFTSLMMNQALSGFLPQFGSVLTTARAHGHGAFADSLLTSALHGKYRNGFFKLIEQATADQLLGFLQSLADGTRITVLCAFDEDGWLALRQRRQALPLSGVIGLFEVLDSHRRGDLSHAEARAIVLLANTEDWHQQRIGLRCFSAILLHSQTVTEAELIDFNRRVASPKWLDLVFAEESSETLTTFLGVLCQYGSESILSNFRRPALQLRLNEAGLNALSHGTAKAVKSLALIGAGALVGMQPNNAGIALFDVASQQWLARKIAHSLSEGRPIEAMKFQVWIGLVVLSRPPFALQELPHQLVQPFIQFWQRTDSDSNSSADVMSMSVGMTNWLKQNINSQRPIYLNAQSVPNPNSMHLANGDPMKLLSIDQ